VPKKKKAGGGKGGAKGKGVSYDDIRRAKKKTGYVVGEAVEGKHKSGGWHNATILAVKEVEGVDLYLLQWADGDETDTEKTAKQLRPRKTIETLEIDSHTVRGVHFGNAESMAEETATAGGGKRKRQVAGGGGGRRLGKGCCPIWQ